MLVFILLLLLFFNCEEIEYLRGVNEKNENLYLYS